MSIKTLTPTNLLSLAAAPTIPTLSTGDTYFDTTLGVRTYNGSSWVSSGYSTVTLGSTALTSGSTVTTVAGLTLTTPTINGAALSGTFSGNPTFSGATTFYNDITVSSITVGHGTGGDVQTFVFGRAALNRNLNGLSNIAIGDQVLYYSNTQATGSITVTSGGSGYTNGTYTNVTMTYVSGTAFSTYPVVTIVVSGGSVTSATITGTGFTAGTGVNASTVLSATAASIGGTGSGFTGTVVTVVFADGNVAIGQSAVYSKMGGSYNTVIGYNALSNATRISNTVAIGANAGAATLTGGNSVFIGYNAGAAETLSNKLYISNSSTSTPLIYGDFSTPALTINGSLTATGTLTTNLTTAGYVTTTSGGVIGSVATIPNAGLTNNSVTIGSTSVALGTTAATIAGLTLTTPTINGLTSTDSTDLTKKLIYSVAGNTTGVTGTLATAFTTAKTITFPDVTGTVALTNNSFFIGTQSIALNQGTGTVTALPGVTSVNGTTIPAAATLLTSASTVFGGITPTALATGFSLAGGTTSKTLTVSNTLTLAGTDTSTLNIGAGGTLGTAAFTASTAYLAAGVTSLPLVTSVNGTSIPASGTLALTNQAFFIGTQSIAINQGSGTITALPGVTSVNGTTIPAAATLLTSASTASALTSFGTSPSLTTPTATSPAITASSAATVGTKITGFASQTADLLQIIASGPTVLASTTAAGIEVIQQPTPTAVNATATLTIAQLLTLIITATGTVANSMTLPTGTLMDAGFNAIATNQAFDWSIINTGSSAGAVTVLAGTAHTIVGSATVAITTSGRFRSRRTAATTWVTYRIA